MTTLDSDTFSRANVSGGWGTASSGSTWAFSGVSETLSITSDEGVEGSLTSGDWHAQLGSTTAATVNILVRLKVDDTLNFAGVMGRYSSSGGVSGYRIGLYSGTIKADKFVSGTRTQIGTPVSFSYTTSQWVWVRGVISGTTITGTAWLDGNSEPGSPQFTVTDSSVSAAGLFGLSSFMDSGNNSFDHFTATDNSSGGSATKSTGLRARIKTAKVVSTGLRTRIKTSVTKTTGLRTRIKTQKTLTTGLRMVTPAPGSATLTTGLRAPVSTAHALSAALRAVIRSTETRTTGLRFRIPVGAATLTTGLRFVTQSASNVLAQDTFSRVNQSGWGTASDGQTWTSFGSVTANIVGDEGVLTNSTGYPGMLLGSKTTDTISIQVRLSQDDINHGCGVCFRYQDPNNYYFVALYQSQIYFSAIISGSYHNFVLGGYAASTGSYSQLLVEMSGNHVQAVAWSDHTNQPADAILDTTDTTFSSGQFGVSVNAFTGTGGPSFDSFFVTNTVAGMGSPGSGGGSGSSISIPWNGLGKSKQVPIPLSLISRGVPAYTNDDYGGAYPATLAVDGDYQTLWRCQNTPTSAAPIYLALDLSGVATSKREQVIFQWLNDPTTGAWNSSLISVNYYNVPKAYTIDANAAAGGSYPTTGWVTLATETDNPYHSRMYALNLTGYNWVRINVTDVNGSDLNMSVELNVDVYNVANGIEDCWAFGGDSITQQGALHNDQAGGTFAQLIAAYNSQFYPAFDSWGIGGFTSSDAFTNWSTWMATFPGKYITINYGTNDANEGGIFMTTFQDHMQSMVEAVIAAGKIPVVPLIPWGATNNLLANVPTLNAIIQQLYTTYPQIIQGPDMYTYYSQNQNLIGADGIHPTLTDGYDAWRQLWVNAMMTNVYTPPPTTLVVFPRTYRSPSPYGGSVVPVHNLPTLPYSVSGVDLDVQPTLMTAPNPTGSAIPAGASFTLGFTNPSAMVTSLFADGALVTLRFGLHDGSSRTGLVQVSSTLSGSYLLVTCTLQQPTAPNTWVIDVQSP